MATPDGLQRHPWAHLDGAPIAPERGVPPDALPGLVGGDGAFETLRVERGVAFFARAHVDRLCRTLEHLRLLASHDDALDLRARIDEGLRALPPSHGAAAEDHEAVARLRIVVWPDAAARRGLRVLLLATPDRGAVPAPLRLCGIADPRPADALTVGKHGSWGFASLARRRAREAGCDDALLLRGDRAVEGTFGTLLVVRPGTDALVTPPLHDGALDGITLREVAAIETVARASVAWNSLDRAALVLLSSVRLATPVASLRLPDGTLVGTDVDRAVAVAARLHAALRDRALQRPEDTR